MKTKHNKAHVAIAFLGDYRPAYFAGKTTTEAVVIALAAIDDLRIADKLKALAWQFTRENSGESRCSAISSESYDGGPLSVSINDRPFEPWLSNILDSMPEHPAIDYSKSEAH
jgi:hypothetical protein